VAPSLTFPDHFSASSSDYARYRPDYPDSLFAYLADLAAQRRRAWDCATGSGQAALGLSRHFEEVIATDASERQIANARPRRRVRYRVAAAEDSGLDAESIDLVTVAQAVHWFDLGRFWREVRRVLVPGGGVVAVWCYDLVSVDAEVDRVVDRLYRVVVGPYWPPERALVEAGYGTIEFPFAEQTPPAFRMEKRWALDDFAGYLRTWSAAKRYREAVGGDPIDVVRADLLRAWGVPGRVRRIFWTLALRVGRKT
jgi:SAM-dependent methyltransferase